MGGSHIEIFNAFECSTFLNNTWHCRTPLVVICTLWMTVLVMYVVALPSAKYIVAGITSKCGYGPQLVKTLESYKSRSLLQYVGFQPWENSSFSLIVNNRLLMH